MTAFVGVTPTEIGFSVIVAVVVLVGSLMLVAVNITVVVALTGEDGALYVTPVVDEEVSEPGPEPMPQLTPELVESLTTESVKLCDPPMPKAIVTGLIGLRLIGFETVEVSGTLIDALLVESALLVAVTVAVAVTTGVGAV
jgi:hypothetical protein